jgi:hypothetical protein
MNLNSGGPPETTVNTSLSECDFEFLFIWINKLLLIIIYWMIGSASLNVNDTFNIYGKLDSSIRTDYIRRAKDYRLRDSFKHS